MEISMTALFHSFLWSVVVGVCLGALYDMIRIQRVFFGVTYAWKSAEILKDIKLPIISKYQDEIFRKKRAPGAHSNFALNIIVFIGDILFFILFALVAVVFIYHTNDGKVRWMIFFGFALGFAAYYFTLGKAVMFFSQYIVFALKSALSYIVIFTVIPIRKVFLFVFRVCYRVKIKIYTRSEKKRILNASRLGFMS